VSEANIMRSIGDGASSNFVPSQINLSTCIDCHHCELITAASKNRLNNAVPNQHSTMNTFKRMNNALSLRLNYAGRARWREYEFDVRQLYVDRMTWNIICLPCDG
jgi:hypothetical protein